MRVLIPLLAPNARKWAQATVGGLPLIRRMVLEEARKGAETIFVLLPQRDETLASALNGTPAKVRIIPGNGDEAIGDGAWIVRDVPVHDESSRRQLEERLLSGLIKETEGLMSRLINRRISRAVTRRLMNRPITPNQMTWMSLAIGLTGALFFLSPGRGPQVAGALLFLLHAILDGCDGELARLKFQESRSGGLLDYWSDNVVHVAVFLCIGGGWARQVGATWPLLPALAAATGAMACAWLIYARTMRDKTAGGPLYTSVVDPDHADSMLVRIADILSRRDFIYLVLVLALLGKVHLFLILAAAGAPAYAFVVWWIGRREQASHAR